MMFLFASALKSNRSDFCTGHPNTMSGRGRGGQGLGIEFDYYEEEIEEEVCFLRKHMPFGVISFVLPG